MSDRMEIARAAWGDIPDWIEALVAACDAAGSSQSKVAKQIGRSPGVISSALRNEYAGNMAVLEERVRAVICAEQVKCPALDWISSADCLFWRDYAAKLTSAAYERVLMFRACRNCDRFTRGGSRAVND
ncbi:hypothetical protein KX928_12760 [Roseobacter sp. YSTF-M11]|uniref:Uncharacterized protein n=1 Tax=Roseobacter insulae TaxID=2859783 RepID=A0A9X1FW31_9RHOB|nr:hypothetical protein [Roseobacter insulae]MBW4708656.1 hypothetical protein [Roseobacter insulae]